MFFLFLSKKFFFTPSLLLQSHCQNHKVNKKSILPLIILEFFFLFSKTKNLLLFATFLSNSRLSTSTEDLDLMYCTSCIGIENIEKMPVRNDYICTLFDLIFVLWCGYTGYSCQGWATPNLISPKSGLYL